MDRLGTHYRTALDAVIGSKATPSQAIVFDYDDSKDFSALWGEAEGGSPLIDRTKPVVIVWDGQMDVQASGSEKLVASHLSPLDWALAFSIKVLGGRPRPGNDFRIHIVDLTGKVHDTWAMRMRHTLLAEMPWVSLHAPLIPYKDGEPMRYRRAYSRIVAEGEGCAGLLSLIANGQNEVELSQVGKPMPGENADVQLALESLARQWSASLVQGDDHHNVNNFVGPVILSQLLEDLPASPSEQNARDDDATGERMSIEVEAATADESDLLHVFVQKLKWTNALSRPKGKIALPTRFENQLTAAGIAGMRVLVVDDELGRGWDGVICRLFSKKRGGLPLDDGGFVRLDEADAEQDAIQIFGCHRPTPLLEALGTDSRKRFFERDLEFSYTNGAELLVLDLRLFSQAGSADSRAYVRGLVSRIREWGLCQPENLAWPAIDEREISLVESWLERNAEPIDPSTEASAITLLPRILALAAPLTPIILFSSTGRADIKEKLKPYRNILAGFSKPQALQDFGTIKESISEFSAGIEDGARMLAIRSRLAKCIKIAREEEVTRDKSRPRAHVDFYFDESGNSQYGGFVLASAATVFRTVEQANKLQDHFKKKASSAAANENLPVWRKARGNEGTPLLKYSDIKRHRDDAANVFHRSVNVLKEAIKDAKADVWPKAWTSLCVSKYDNAPKQFRSRPFRWMDEQLDLMLRFSVQFNFCVLPRYLGFEHTTCNLYFDRRSIPPTQIKYDDPKAWNTSIRNQEHQKAEELSERYGCEITQPPLSSYDQEKNPNGPNKVLVTTYSESAYYPLVREALMAWAPDWTKCIEHEEVRGQQLSECSAGYNLKSGDLNKFEKRRWLHDVADWVAGADKDGDKKQREANTSKLSTLFPRRLKTRLGVGLEASLRAAQSASWGRADECIRALIENPNVYDLNAHPDAVERILIWVCRDTLRLSSGNSLHLMLDVKPPQEPARRKKDQAGKPPKQACATPESCAPPSAGDGSQQGQTAAEVQPRPTPGPDVDLAPSPDPWRAVALYHPPLGYEVLEVAGKEPIDDQDYWVLRQRNGTEVAVTPVREEDAPKNRLGGLGLFYTYGDQVSRNGKGGFCAFPLDHWFGDEADSVETSRSAEVDDQTDELSSVAQREHASAAPEDEDVAVSVCDDGSVTLTKSDRLVSTDLSTGPEKRQTADVRNGEPDALREIPDWRALSVSTEGAIEARVFKVVASNKVVCRGSNAADRSVYCSDEINLPALVRDDRVVIRPRQGGMVMIQGYVMCDLVAWYSGETTSWTAV